MFPKIKNIFVYVWPILHNFFIEKYWDPSHLCAAFGGAKKKSSSTADMIPADWVAETEKVKNVVKVFTVQWRRIFEKYQYLTKWRSYEKKRLFSRLQNGRFFNAKSSIFIQSKICHVIVE